MVRMNDLIELGSRNVSDMIKDWINAESPSEGIDIQDHLLRGEEFPRLSSATVEAVAPLFSFLKTLPSHPRTHHAPFSSALVAYSETRGMYMDASLAPLLREVLSQSQERLGSSAGRAGMTAAWHQAEEESNYARGSSGLAAWISATLDFAESEFGILSDLLQSLHPPSSQSTLHSTFSRLLRTPLRSFADTLTGLLTEVRRSSSTTHNFFVFDIIGVLTNATMRWDAVIVANCSRQQEMGNSQHEITQIHALTENLAATRSVAIEIFPTFIAGINAMPQQREGEVPSTTINEITYSSLNFMRQLCEYADVVAPLLSTLGAGMWMMGSERAPVLSLSIESESQGILSQYLTDVLAALLNALEARSRAIRQPSTASIFLLNNVGHVLREVRSDKESDEQLASYLGNVGAELIDGAMLSANTAYLDAWNPVVSVLMEDRVGMTSTKSSGKIVGMGGGGERAAVKDKFAYVKSTSTIFVLIVI